MFKEKLKAVLFMALFTIGFILITAGMLVSFCGLAYMGYSVVLTVYGGCSLLATALIEEILK